MGVGGGGKQDVNHVLGLHQEGCYCLKNTELGVLEKWVRSLVLQFIGRVTVRA